MVKNLLLWHWPGFELLSPNCTSGNFVSGSALTPRPDSQTGRRLFYARQEEVFDLRRAQVAVTVIPHTAAEMGHQRPLQDVQGKAPEKAQRVKSLRVKIICKKILHLPPNYSRRGLRRHNVTGLSLEGVLSENSLCANLSGP